MEFYKAPENYESDAMKLAKVSDMFIAGHFNGQGAPVFYPKDDIQDTDFATLENPNSYDIADKDHGCNCHYTDVGADAFSD